MERTDYKTHCEIFPEWVSARLEKAQIYGIPNTILSFRAKGFVENFKLVGLPDFIDAEYKLRFCNETIDYKSYSGVIPGVAIRQKLMETPWKSLFDSKHAKFLTNMYEAKETTVDYSKFTFDVSRLSDPFLYLVFDCSLDDEIVKNLSIVYKRINVAITSDGVKVLRWTF
jgi:hypothetical protein